MEQLIRSALSGSTPLLVILLALLAGAVALVVTPREEEPQIVVPMVDLIIDAPGVSAQQVERQVTIPVEKLLAQIGGVEHVYSVSRSGGATVTLRFYVGEDREDALLDTWNKLQSNRDAIPAVVADWFVKPIEVDDVPIVVLGLWSDDPGRYGDYELRRFANEMSTSLKALPATNRVSITGGRERRLQVLLDADALAARKTTPLDVGQALGASNRLAAAGTLLSDGRVNLVEAGDFLRTLDEVERLPVNVIDGIPVLLGEVATLVDGPALPRDYTWLDFAPGHPHGAEQAMKHPMVALAVAKQPGANAVWVADDVHARVAQWQAEVLPPEIHVEVLRDYGRTADEKVDNLASSLAVAVLTVVLFIGVFLGVRPALVVGLAVPVCYGATLLLDMTFGYTINRVTLFALILSLGLLVDDPITGVDNIERKLREPDGTVADRVVDAMIEIRTALVMSTLTIMLAFAPLAFITGMMGPYMAPMAFNVPVSVVMSTVVAFLVTPWLAARLLRPTTVTDEVAQAGLYTRLVDPIISNPAKARMLLWVVLVLFIAALLLPVMRLVPLKLLPFDNKDEVQVVIDLPEGASLEQTAALADAVGRTLRRMPEVEAIAYFVGRPSPMDFNGMVRHYYQREGTHLADIRVTLVPKAHRADQSHALVLRMREQLAPLVRPGVHVRVVEVPPGPPVLSTLVGEIYGEPAVSYQRQRDAAGVLAARLAAEPHVVDVDTLVGESVTRHRFITDKTKAALSGVATEDISATLAAANHGLVASHFNLSRESTPLPIELRLDRTARESLRDLEHLQVRGRPGIVRQDLRTGLEAAPQPLVAIGELGHFESQASDLPIHRKDLRQVVYVTAELSGRTPAEVIADVVADQDAEVTPNTWTSRSFLAPGGTVSWSLPQGTSVSWAGEGEWRITLRVFRDMGIAFAFAMVAILVVLRIQTGSLAVALIIMSAIPLTFIGIMPGFWLMGAIGGGTVAGAPDPTLFTATAMIGMIALAGIVVRNSLILVEFIRQARDAGADLRTAILQAGEVRLRPILLTAGTTLLGNLIIILDPVFSGLALAIIFGIVSSTLFTLLVVPAVYYLMFRSPDLEASS